MNGKEKVICKNLNFCCCYCFFLNQNFKGSKNLSHQKPEMFSRTTQFTLAFCFFLKKKHWIQQWKVSEREKIRWRWELRKGVYKYDRKKIYRWGVLFFWFYIIWVFYTIKKKKRKNTGKNLFVFVRKKN